MGASNRSQQFVRLFKALKKAYKPFVPDEDMPLLDSLLFAACLEDTPYTKARKVYDRIRGEFFDWNEVRVSSIRDLVEVMTELPDPAAAAARVKQTLQHVFESRFSFDLEGLRREKLKAVVAELEKIDGCDQFMISCVIQWQLQGHSIPLDRGALTVLNLLGLAREEDIQAGTVPGLERAISKKDGREFGSLLHELGAAYIANPFSTNVRKFIVGLRPEAAELLPTRRSAKRRRAAIEAKKAEKAKARRRKSDQEKTEKVEPAADSAGEKSARKKASSGKKKATTSRKKASGAKKTGKSAKTKKTAKRKTASKSPKAKKAAKSSRRKPR
ncbi:hypothetical protein JCM19992_10970 [Thermostilla marina]